MLMNQTANGITMQDVGDCFMVINLNESEVDIKSDGKNLTITIKKKADINQLWHNTTSGDTSNMRATIGTLKAHATYIDNI